MNLIRQHITFYGSMFANYEGKSEQNSFVSCIVQLEFIWLVRFHICRQVKVQVTHKSNLTLWWRSKGDNKSCSLSWQGKDSPGSWGFLAREWQTEQRKLYQNFRGVFEQLQKPVGVHQTEVKSNVGE